VVAWSNTVNPRVVRRGARKPVPVKAKYYTKDLSAKGEVLRDRIGNPTVVSRSTGQGEARGIRRRYEASVEFRIFAARVRELWGDNRDISQRTNGLAHIVSRKSALAKKNTSARFASEEYKAKLRANTERPDQRGGLGFAHGMFVKRSMFFGNDSNPLVGETRFRP